MREEFEKMAAAGKIEARQVEPLFALATSGYCMHRSWGFGRIKTVDTVFARFTIDFTNKPGHAMDLAFAAESLKPISKDHILARKAADLEGLRQMAALHHLDLIKVVLNSYGGRATVDQIQQVLVPDVIRDDWKKWWDTARQEMKKDGHFQVPLKKTEPVIYQAQEISLQQRLLSEFKTAKGLKAHVAVATELVKNAADLSDKVAVANEVIPVLNGEINSHQRTQSAVALEGVFVRDDLRQLTGQPEVEGEVSAAQIWAQESKINELMETLPAAKHRRAIESFKSINPERWSDVLRSAINGVSARLCKEFAQLLIQEGKGAELKDTLARLISQHSANSELLLWLGKERSDAFADILGPEVLRAMLTAMERDQFNEKRSGKLRDFILSDQALVVDLTASADIDVVKDLTRALQFSPVFDDMDKRSLLARLVKSHPAVQSLVSGEATKQEAALIVSWESLERRNNEYRELVDKKIPANSKEIAIARSYGDLSENHEYKAAKEMQGILQRTKAELEVMLARARGTDFSNTKTDVAGIGTVIRVTDLNTNQVETLTVLGAWDSDAERSVISYLSPVGKALIGRKVGEEVEFELEGTRHRHRIEGISAYEASPKQTPIAEPTGAATAATPAAPDAASPHA